ncbi:MAG: aminoacyl-tRNA hydrolase [Planctomycetota bacterium]
MKLIAGLGNPGTKYEGTRHNVGFAAVDRVAADHATEKPSRKFEALLTEVFRGPEKWALLKPQTYMNLSGRSLRAAADFYRVEPEDILVVCDDMNLPPGTIRLRGSGSAGGQNGLKDVITHFGTEAVPRLRIGVGRPKGRVADIDFVLSAPRGDDAEEITLGIALAADAVVDWAEHGIDRAMNTYNVKPKP